MPKTQAVEAKIVEIIVDTLIVDETEVTPGANLREELGADSLDLVEVCICMEEAFGIEFDDADGDKMKLVSDVFKITEKKIKEKEA